MKVLVVFTSIICDQNIVEEEEKAEEERHYESKNCI
jgi:hypothetical protein